MSVGSDPKTAGPTLAPVELDNRNQVHGIDELNLAEFPLASISERLPDDLKTMVFEDKIFDRNERRMVTRRLTLSGSDRYGLPTAIDDDVLLACLQISKLQEFDSPVVTFSRYELLKMLHWSDDTRNYHRLAQSLRRWKGLTIFSDRAFYDHKEKSWVNRDFGVFDSVTIYRRENHGTQGRSLSRFTWNEVLFQSFQSGYLKRLDWSLYTSLESPVAKRLYRFLDKRFYRGNSVEIDLHDLAFRKIWMSGKYNVAQIKRVLRKGLAELEARWDLKPMADSQRFEKRSNGQWTIRLERKPKRRPLAAVGTSIGLTTPAADPAQLETALAKRGIGPATANDLAEQFPAQSIQTMIELFDWYNLHGQSRNPGFLVSAIRNPATINFPTGFASSNDRMRLTQAKANQIAGERELQTARQRRSHEREEMRLKAFTAFWDSLSPAAQAEFEGDAIDHAEPTKRSGYYRTQGEKGPLFENYRTIILRDHFERTTVARNAKRD